MGGEKKLNQKTPINKRTRQRKNAPSFYSLVRMLSVTGSLTSPALMVTACTVYTCPPFSPPNVTMWSRSSLLFTTGSTPLTFSSVKRKASKTSLTVTRYSKVSWELVVWELTSRMFVLMVGSEIEWIWSLWRHPQHTPNWQIRHKKSTQWTHACMRNSVAWTAKKTYPNQFSGQRNGWHLYFLDPHKYN